MKNKKQKNKKQKFQKVVEWERNRFYYKEADRTDLITLLGGILIGVSFFSPSWVFVASLALIFLLIYLSTHRREVYWIKKEDEKT